jgi:DNA-binding transcriptional regulator YbjK
MLLCHIIGINNKFKNKFIDDVAIISNYIIILDLDDISKKILFDTEYTKLYNQYMQKKEKELLTKLGQLWKIKFTDNINILLDHNKDKQIKYGFQLTWICFT